jgi:hypothetical protein
VSFLQLRSGLRPRAFSDGPAAASPISASFSDAVLLDDALTALLAMLAGLSDTLGVTDAAAGRHNYLASFGENLET